MKPLSCQVAITGASAITSAGTGLKALADAVMQKRSCLSPLPEELEGGAGLQWGRALHFKATDHIPPLKARKLDRASQFAVSTAGLALADASIDKGSIAPERIGIALGCGFGGIGNSAEFLTGYFQNGAAGLSPMLFPNTVANAAASNASIEYGLKGPNITFIQRFCSAESALLAACRFIEEGRADLMLAGGVDDLSLLMMKGFIATGQIRRYAAGFAEGAGILVLERYDHAVARGAVIKAKIESIATIGMLMPGAESQGIEKLVQPGSHYDYLTVSGTEASAEPFFAKVGATSVFKPGQQIGCSLAMGGSVLGFLSDKVSQGGVGLHLAASPEGPYFAVTVRGAGAV